MPFFITSIFWHILENQRKLHQRSENIFLAYCHSELESIRNYMSWSRTNCVHYEWKTRIPQGRYPLDATSGIRAQRSVSMLDDFLSELSLGWCATISWGQLKAHSAPGTDFSQVNLCRHSTPFWGTVIMAQQSKLALYKLSTVACMRREKNRVEYAD